MKSTFAILTFLVAAIVVSPRQSFGQYAWVPVYSDDGALEADYDASGQTGYATYVGEESGDIDNAGKDEDCKSKGKSGGKTSDCGCASCRGPSYLRKSFGGVEYLHWWNKGRSLPPLASRGVVPPSAVLFGNNDVGDDLKSGVRFTAGVWLDDCQTNAVVLRGFGTGGDETRFSDIGAAAGPFLATPFFDLFTNTPGALAVNVGGDSGSISSTASNDVLGAEIYFRTLLDRGSDYRLDLLGGYQMTRIDDDLALTTVSTNPFTTSDLFDVSNEYHAAEFGLLGEVYKDCTTIQLMGKVGVGNMQQTVDISGSSSLAGVPTPGGLFARPSNIGSYSRDLLVWSPEVGIKLIQKVRDNISISVGYTFMYWTSVALAGDQVDTGVNSQALFNGGGADSTTFAFRDTDFWAQTIDIGMLIRY